MRPRRGRLLVQGLASIQPHAGVVVGVDIGGRIGRRVQDEDIGADQRAEHGEREGDEMRRARLDNRSQVAGSMRVRQPSLTPAPACASGLGPRHLPQQAEARRCGG